MRLYFILIIILTSQTLIGQNHKVYNSLEEAFKEPDSVLILILEGKELTSLSDSITLFVNIEVLDLSVNNFKEIPSSIFELTSLKELYLAGAYSYIDEYERWDYLLDTIPPEIGKLNNLEVLDLSYNKINQLPKEIKELSRLRRLNLWHNNFTSKSLIQVCELKQLTGFCKIKSITCTRFGQ